MTGPWAMAEVVPRLWGSAGQESLGSRVAIK